MLMLIAEDHCFLLGGSGDEVITLWGVDWGLRSAFLSLLEHHFEIPSYASSEQKKLSFDSGVTFVPVPRL